LKSHEELTAQQRAVDAMFLMAHQELRGLTGKHTLHGIDGLHEAAARFLAPIETMLPEVGFLHGGRGRLYYIHLSTKKQVLMAIGVLVDGFRLKGCYASLCSTKWQVDNPN
jgi:hypothetical protein